MLDQGSYQAYHLRKARFISNLRADDHGPLSVVSKRLEGEVVNLLPPVPSESPPVVGQPLGACQGATAVVPGMVYSVVCDGRLYYCCLGSGDHLARGSTIVAAPVHASAGSTTARASSTDGSNSESMHAEAPGSPAHTLETATTVCSSVTTSPATSPLLRPITAIHDIGPLNGSSTPPLPSSPSRMSTSSNSQPDNAWDDGWVMVDPLPRVEFQPGNDTAGGIIEEVVKMKTDYFEQLMEYLWTPKTKDKGRGER